MAQNTARKRREAEAQQEQIKQAAVISLVEDDRGRALNFMLALLAGALVSILVLFILKFGVRDLWLPFNQTSGRFFRALLISGALGGAAAAFAGRGAKPPLPAGACALGWGIFGTLQHVLAPGKYTSFLTDVIKPSSDEGRLALGIFFNNAAFQPVSIILGLVAASLTGWLVTERLIPRRTPPEDSAPGAAKSGGSGASAPISRTISFAVGIAAIGLILMWAIGWIPLRTLPKISVTDLPTVLPRAVLSAVISVLAFGIAGFIAGRWSRMSGTTGYLLAAPVVTILISAIMQGSGGHRLFLPLASVLWNSSPIELASWGVFAAVAGFWVREVNTRN